MGARWHFLLLFRILICIFILCRLLKGRSFPGKILLTQKSEPLNEPVSPIPSPTIEKSYYENDIGLGEHMGSTEVILPDLCLLITF